MADEKKEVKKRAVPQKRERQSLKEYLKSVRLEMKKVVWPTKKELTTYTLVVVVVCAFFALGFWAIDSAFLAMLRALLGISL